MATLSWNPKVKLILSDVDETVADLYVAAEPDMIEQLKSILEDGIALFFITGQSLKSVQWRIIDQLPMHLRRLILVEHCSGAEVWGYSPDGTLQPEPFYSLYASALSKSQQQ